MPNSFSRHCSHRDTARLSTLVDRRVTQTGSEVWSRTCPSSQPLCVFSLIERHPQTPNPVSNAGNAQAQGNQGGLFFGYFHLAAQKKVTSPGSATRRFNKIKSHRRPWIPAYAGMTGLVKE